MVTVAERIARSQADYYRYSWLCAAESTAFDYEQKFSELKHRELLATSELLGERYFQHLDALKALSEQPEVRVLFCFI